MIFRILDYNTRARPDEPPLPGSYRRIYTRVDHKGFPSDEHVRANIRQLQSWWFSKGDNHRNDGDTMLRDVIDHAWFIDIADLDALLAISDEHIVCVDRTNLEYVGFPTLHLDGTME